LHAQGPSSMSEQQAPTAELEASEQQEQTPNKESLVMAADEEVLSTGESAGEVAQEEEASETASQEADHGAKASWMAACERIRSSGEPVALELLRRFEDRYAIESSTDALANIPAFLGGYMVREFDYLRFCLSTELVTEESAFDDAQWAAYVSANLTKDLVSASSLMLRLAMLIVKQHGLDSEDWHDVHEVCKGAVRGLPSCYKLQRSLPGALSVARQWKHLPEGPSDEHAKAYGNPWQSEESRGAFEDMYKLEWDFVEAVIAQDKQIVSGFSGGFRVVELTDTNGMTLVTLEVIYVGPCPTGFTEKAIELEMILMWEVEDAVGRLLETGMRIEADFLEVNQEICFMHRLSGVTPSWATR